MKEIIGEFVSGGINEVNVYLLELQQDYNVYQVIELERVSTARDYGYSIILLVEKK